MLRRYLALVSMVLIVPMSAQAADAVTSGNVDLVKTKDQEVVKKAEKPIVKDPDAPIVASTAKPIVSAAPPSWLNANTLAPVPKAVPLSAQPVPALNSSASPLVASPVGAVSSAPLAPLPGTELNKEGEKDLKKEQKALSERSERNKAIIKNGAEQLNVAKDAAVSKSVEKALEHGASVGLKSATKAVLGANNAIIGASFDLIEHGAPKSLKEAAVVGLKAVADQVFVEAATAAAALIPVPGSAIAGNIAASEYVALYNPTGKFLDWAFGTHRYSE